MTIEHLPIASLSPDPANARRHGERNLDADRRQPPPVRAAEADRRGRQPTWCGPATARWPPPGRPGVDDRSPSSGPSWPGRTCRRTRWPTTGRPSWPSGTPRCWRRRWPTRPWATSGSPPRSWPRSPATCRRTMPDDEGGVDPLPPEKWLVVVTCDGEAHQADVLERFDGRRADVARRWWGKRAKAVPCRSDVDPWHTAASEARDAIDRVDTIYDAGAGRGDR